MASLPHAGAWIETFCVETKDRPFQTWSLPHAGAWIETITRLLIDPLSGWLSLPHAGAWIETECGTAMVPEAPVSRRSLTRERGLKPIQLAAIDNARQLGYRRSLTRERGLKLSSSNMR